MNITERPVRGRRGTRALVAAPVLALALALGACSSTPAAPPTVDKMSEGFKKIISDAGLAESFNDAQITCIAEKILASDIDPDTLANLAAGRDVQKNEAEKQQVADITATATRDCLASVK